MMIVILLLKSSDIQYLMDSFLTAYSASALTITLKKTAVIHQPASDKAYSVLNIYLYGQKLQIVEKFYLGSTVNMTNTCDDDISL